MNPFAMLKEDHRKIRALFKDYEGLGDRANKKKEKLTDRIFHDLEIHTKVEEDLFYPKVKECIETKDKKLVAEAFEEHLIVKRLIDELKKLHPGDEVFEAKFKVLRAGVRQHMAEEEGDLFPKAKKALNGEEAPLGDSMEEEKGELQNHSALGMLSSLLGVS